LNNIYAATQLTSPKAAGMITGLSDMLRYMLYDCNQSLVPLSKELKMVKDYINLEKIRYGNKLDLHIDLPAQTEGFYIAPLLLLPLIENSFKHGTSNMLEQPWVNLQINIQGNQLQMKLINGKMNDPEKKTGHTGIGIANVQKRLALLYPEKHELVITKEEEVFIASLKVELEQKKEKIKQLVPEPELKHV
jgi:LytS/YehU family sensor histidine kinase